MASKSPFYVIEEFVSPLLCEELLDACDFTVPDSDKDGRYVKTTKTCERAEAIVYERLLLALPEIQAHYQMVYKGTERVKFEWHPQGSQGEFLCENSTFLRGKWLRDKQRDLTGILFLSEYQDNIPFEEDYEVYGGKLEFVQHKFGFNPKRGTLIVFPSDPHFINITTQILAGDLFQARIQMAAKTPYIYNPQQFPGNYTTWFAPLLSNG
jgi:hypothetical protein